MENEEKLKLLNNLSRFFILFGYLILIVSPICAPFSFILSLIFSYKKSDKDMFFNFIGSIIGLIVAFIYIIFVFIS